MHKFYKVVYGNTLFSLLNQVQLEERSASESKLI